MSRPDKFPDCMALSSKREACLGYRETFTKLDLEEKENERLRVALSSSASWLERWARHVGNCEGGAKCTCGLTAVSYDASAALADADGQRLPHPPQ